MTYGDDGRISEAKIQLLLHIVLVTSNHPTVLEQSIHLLVSYSLHGGDHGLTLHFTSIADIRNDQQHTCRFFTLGIELLLVGDLSYFHWLGRFSRLGLGLGRLLGSLLVAIVVTLGLTAQTSTDEILCSLPITMIEKERLLLKSRPCRKPLPHGHSGNP